jgi:hypothetical protein
MQPLAPPRHDHQVTTDAMPERRPEGFVSLKTLTKGVPAPEAALEEIRRIYFRTGPRTIEHDFAHAIELLKSLPSEEEREKASVFMEGLAEMRREWEKVEKRKAARKPRRRRTPGGTG